MTVRLALFEPDIPQNTGALMRLAACLDVGLDVIEPCGFLLDDKRLRRAGMDYLALLDWRRHVSWHSFLADLRPSPPTCDGATAIEPQPRSRLVLLTTQASLPYTRFAFAPGDVLLVGRETGGVPDAVQAAADARVLVPMRPEARSLNVALAAAMVLGEALRQTRTAGV